MRWSESGIPATTGTTHAGGWAARNRDAALQWAEQRKEALLRAAVIRQQRYGEAEARRNPAPVLPSLPGRKDNAAHQRSASVGEGWSGAAPASVVSPTPPRPAKQLPPQPPTRRKARPGRAPGSQGAAPRCAFRERSNSATLHLALPPAPTRGGGGAAAAVPAVAGCAAGVPAGPAAALPRQLLGKQGPREGGQRVLVPATAPPLPDHSWRGEQEAALTAFSSLLYPGSGPPASLLAPAAGAQAHAPVCSGTAAAQGSGTARACNDREERLLHDNALFNEPKLPPPADLPRAAQLAREGGRDSGETSPLAGEASAMATPAAAAAAACLRGSHEQGGARAAAHWPRACVLPPLASTARECAVGTSQAGEGEGAAQAFSPVPQLEGSLAAEGQRAAQAASPVPPAAAAAPVLNSISRPSLQRLKSRLASMRKLQPPSAAADAHVSSDLTAQPLPCAPEVWRAWQNPMADPQSGVTSGAHWRPCSPVLQPRCERSEAAALQAAAAPLARQPGAHARDAACGTSNAARTQGAGGTAAGAQGLSSLAGIDDGNCAGRDSCEAATATSAGAAVPRQHGGQPLGAATVGQGLGEHGTVSALAPLQRRGAAARPVAGTGAVVEPDPAAQGRRPPLGVRARLAEQARSLAAEQQRQCPSCQRTFVSDNYERHVAICEKVFVRKRAPFDAKQRRTAHLREMAAGGGLPAGGSGAASRRSLRRRSGSSNEGRGAPAVRQQRSKLQLPALWHG